jgi:hypothetical protein
MPFIMSLQLTDTHLMLQSELYVTKFRNGNRILVVAEYIRTQTRKQIAHIAVWNFHAAHTQSSPVALCNLPIHRSIQPVTHAKEHPSPFALRAAKTVLRFTDFLNLRKQFSSRYLGLPCTPNPDEIWK